MKIVEAPSVKDQLELHEYEKLEGTRDLTVLAGYVREWPRFQRPIVLETSADWVSRKDVNDCNLQLPALTGAAGAASLVEAEPCDYLDAHYMPTACVDPPGETGAASLVLNSSLRVSGAVSMVSGTPLADAGSSPTPQEIDGAHGWTCKTPVGSEGPEAAAGPEAGAGLAAASVVNQSDCHAIATVESSTWHRDFLIVLIGALIGVGIHMLFQSIADTPAERRRRGAA